MATWTARRRPGFAAQLLTLDAEGTRPIRLELQNLDAELPAALSVMGVLDVVRGTVSAYAGGRIEGPALGILAAARHRLAYPSALFVLSEPQVSFDGTVTAVAAREQQARAMLDELFTRVAETTGRERGQVRADARQGPAVQRRRGDRVRPGGRPGHGARRYLGSLGWRGRRGRAMTVAATAAPAPATS